MNRVYIKHEGGRMQIIIACSYTGNITRSGSNVLGRIICNSTLQSLREVRKESNL